MEGMDVLLNPNAARPLHPAILSGTAHHWLREDGQLKSRAPKWQALGSVTRLFVEK